MQVNAALASSAGPWFLPSSAPVEEAATGSPDDGFSLVDLTYVPREVLKDHYPSPLCLYVNTYREHDLRFAHVSACSSRQGFPWLFVYNYN